MFDWHENKQTITIVIYSTQCDIKNIKPFIDGKKLVINKEISIQLYKDVSDKVFIKEYDNKVEIILTKCVEERWDTLLPINGNRNEDFRIKSENVDLQEISDDKEDQTALSFFQKIYEKSSDDVKRAMRKSFLESEGTVLSTNWDDVGNKKVDPASKKP
ncbi:SGS domain-containing protein [Hamiltosporidium magnivora]|uniref:SGS domain-containing protein n=1 Tax=Hamiltosporidium magnivora TaxID=148818 RepID=A0A4Q9LPP8_9MICR|nr:SGS domain-containing protein [Hamiltosporidium magnivora]